MLNKNPLITPSQIQLIVGLGNPGSEYVRTRHNAGMWFLQALAEHYGVTLRSETKFSAAVGKISVGSYSCWLLAPTTYMNDSGRAVLSFAHFYKILPTSILIAHDELDFPVGQVRFKAGGGHGGHNGLRDIIRHLKTGDFIRLRIGIGHPGVKDRVTPYVLGVPSRSDHDHIMAAIDRALIYIPDLLSEDMQKVFQELNAS